MFQASIDANKITITNPDSEWITSGSVNTNFISFTLSEDWKGLTKTVLFQTSHAMIPIILEGDLLHYEMPIPWECMVFVNDTINVGMMGTRSDDTSTEEDEQIVLPTVWGSIPEKVRQGVIVGEPIEGTPTYDSYQALLKVIEDILNNGGGSGSGGGGSGGTGGTYDHRDLTNRDAADQHPIESITDLQETLDQTEKDLQPITDEELEGLLKWDV